MNWDHFERILKIANTLVSIIALAGSARAYGTLKADSEWKRRQGMTTLYQEWRSLFLLSDERCLPKVDWRCPTTDLLH